MQPRGDTIAHPTLESSLLRTQSSYLVSPNLSSIISPIAGLPTSRLHTPATRRRGHCCTSHPKYNATMQCTFLSCETPTKDSESKTPTDNVTGSGDSSCQTQDHPRSAYPVYLRENKKMFLHVTRTTLQCITHHKKRQYRCS
jgi:hypothetical protein